MSCAFVIFNLLLFLIQFNNVHNISSTNSFLDVSNEVFKAHSQGYIAAYDDFNSDKKTDILVISNNGQDLLLYLATSKSQFDVLTLLSGNSTTNNRIIAAVPADFDGDSLTDVLVSRTSSDGGVQSHFYWGQGQGLSGKSSPLNHSLHDQPLVLDFNGDLVPDIFVETLDGRRLFISATSERILRSENLSNSTSDHPLPPLYKPQSSAFIDWNGDLTPDLIIVSIGANSIPQIEVWKPEDGNFKWVQTISGPAINVSHAGVITFTDIDQTSTPDAIYPVCLDSECTSSLLCIYNHSQWIKISLPAVGNDVWNFVPERPGAKWSIGLPIIMRTGDINLDGYPDLLTILKHCYPNKTCVQQTAVMMNKPCEHAECKSFSRSFSTLQDATISSTGRGQSLIPSFFDTSENGKLDIFVTEFIDNKPVLKAYRYTPDIESYFLKIMVIRGKCSKKKCPNGKDSLAVNLPGPTIYYQTLMSNGNPQIGIATQLSQSAYLALQLPYVIYGLGQSPNAVDVLKIGIQHGNLSKVDLNRTWTYVVPNTQMIVIPTPQMHPDEWKTRLFMTYSHLVLLTALALIGTFLLVIVIVAAFQWREYIMDKREKLQEAQKFHFDAM